MVRDGRAIHASRSYVLDLLGERFGSHSFSMLDCGVLSGVMASALADSPSLRPIYTGIDVSQSIIDDCRRRHPEVAFDRASVFDLPYGVNTFDLVHCRHVLEHLPYYETAVREMTRVAGQLMILTFFIPPGKSEVVRRKETAEGYVWLNKYEQRGFENLLMRLWKDVTSTVVSDSKRSDDVVYVCEGKYD